MTALKTAVKFYNKLFKQDTLAGPYEGQTQASPDGVLVDLRYVVKNYQTPAGEFPALRNINLQVKAGEFTAVIGKSGSGKSTLINMVTGIDRPTLGEVIVNGTPIHNLNEDQMAAWRSRNLGVVFQFFQMLPTLTLIENVQLPMLISKLYPRAEHSERAMHLLELVGLADQAHKFPSEVSGGQQQRAAIARSLANDPKILVADEPTGSLDSKTGDAIFRLFEDFVRQGRTILMVTHDRSLAGRVSRVIFISDGELVDELVSDALPNLSQRHQVQVLSRLESESYAPGEEIIRQGDPADTFFIITRGNVEVVMQHPSGQELMLDRLSAGQYFGEMGILENSRRTATVRAAPDSEVTVMQLDREVFAQVMNESHLTREEMAHVVRQRAIEGDLQRALPTLTKEWVAELSKKLEIETFSPGQVVVRQGEPADAFYIIIDGDLDVLMALPNNQERVIDHMTTGEYFGEIALLEGGIRTATVQAHSKVNLMKIDGDTFSKMSAGSHLTAANIADIMRERLIRGYLSQTLPTLSTELLISLPPNLQIKHYPPESIIVRAGDPADIFYIIAGGELELIEQPDGQVVVIDRLGAGQFVGEIILIPGIPQLKTIRVSPNGGAKVIPLEKAVFEKLMTESKETHQAVLQVARQRMATSYS